MLNFNKAQVKFQWNKKIKSIYKFTFLQYFWSHSLLVVVVTQSLSHVWLSATPWTAACQASLFFSISSTLFKLISIESVMLFNHLIFCCSRLLLPSIFPSIMVFSSESALPIRWPKYWSFTFSISPSSESSALISFKINWFDLLAVQGILKSLNQHHGLKASILQCSGLFMVKFSHPYMTTRKTIALTIADIFHQSDISAFKYLHCLGLS